MMKQLNINEILSLDDIEFFKLKFIQYYGTGKEMAVYQSKDTGYILQQDKKVDDLYRVLIKYDLKNELSTN